MLSMPLLVLLVHLVEPLLMVLLLVPLVHQVHTLSVTPTLTATAVIMVNINHWQVKALASIVLMVLSATSTPLHVLAMWLSTVPLDHTMTFLLAPASFAPWVLTVIPLIKLIATLVVLGNSLTLWVHLHVWTVPLVLLLLVTCMVLQTVQLVYLAATLQMLALVNVNFVQLVLCNL